MRRELFLNEKKIKELVSETLQKEYKEIEITHNEQYELILEVKQGYFTEHISFFDEKILNKLNLQELGLKLDCIGIYENEYAYKPDATDEQKMYIFNCDNLKELDE